MDCDTYYYLYNFLDIDTAENLAMLSKMTYDCMPIKYKDIIKFKYLLNRMNNDFYNLSGLYEEDNYYDEGECYPIDRHVSLGERIKELEETFYECICGYEFHRSEAHNHFYWCVTLVGLLIDAIGDSMECQCIRMEILN